MEQVKSLVRSVLPQPLWQLLRRSKQVCYAQAFRVHTLARVGVQLACPKINLGNEDAWCSWCICPSGLSENSVVYSFGVGTDISFDIALIQRFGMRVHAFDPTPLSVAWIQTQHVTEKFVFHKYGVAAHDGKVLFYPPECQSSPSYSGTRRTNASGAIEAPVHRLTTIMGLLGHRRIDLLKMDIEGSEYEVIADMIASGVEVGQLAVEFHDRWPEVGARRTREAIRELKRAGFRVFDVSPRGSEYSFLST